MIRNIVWCLIILSLITGNNFLPTDRDLYVFSTIENTAQSSKNEKSLDGKVQDVEAAETNTYADSYGDTTEFRPEDVALEDSEDDPRGPEDHVIPYSEHEDPEDVPTKPKYVAPGTWAKPDPKKNIPLDFVPTRSLAQVRGTHTVKVLPQSVAIAEATSEEEKKNAPRLREVVSKKKTNTIYTEEGYEDSAYDHAGHIRDADFHEGYARKLHDEHGSRVKSGNGRKKKSKKSKSKYKGSRRRPEEFKEFTDDYSDESAPSEKYKAEGSSKSKKKEYVNKIYKDMWKRPEVNPKIVTENEIEKLERDLKKEAEEAEKGSENYASANSKSSRYSEKPRSDIEGNTEFPSFTTGENFFKENYEATTVQFETPTPGASDIYTSTSSYKNPITNKYYLPSGSALQENYETTTLNYDQLNNPHSVAGDASTTMNYGEMFFKYFQSTPNKATSPTSYTQEPTSIPQPLLVRETTTLGPFEEQNPPVALATINGHGPYLLVSQNGEVTQNPNQFGIGDLPYYQAPQNGHQRIDPNTISNHDYSFTNSHGINSLNGEGFSSLIDSNKLTTSAYDSWGFNNGVYGTQGIPVISADSSTTGFYDNIAFPSTPTYSFITLPPYDYEKSAATSLKDSSYRSNPFLNPATGSIRNRDNSKPQGNKGESFFGYKPNLDYTKMLGFIKSQQNDRDNRQKSESANSEDFTIMKPPVLRESAFSDFTLNSYPNVADYSSMTQESEAARKTNEKKFDAKKNTTKSNDLWQIKNTHSRMPTFYGNDRPRTVVNRKRLFPPSKLLPPPPNSKDNYAASNFANQDNGFYRFSENPTPQHIPRYGSGVQNFSPDPEQLARYLNSRRTAFRYTRSLSQAAPSEEKNADVPLEQEINSRLNFTSEDQGSTKYRDIGVPEEQKSRAKRNLIPEKSQSVTDDSTSLAKEVVLLNEDDSKIYDNRRSRNKRSHQDLLDASHKIAGDVINGEIDSRFKSKDYDAVDVDDDEQEEVEDEVRGEKQVEVDVPDLDYLDEIQDVNDIENIPTSTIATIDFQKYPFYKNTKVPNSSPLKYIIDPKEVPKKTFGGMEFYASRDKYVQCDEVDPNLDDVVPDDEEPVPNRGPKENLPRLRGLGDKLDCFKAKYFGQNPFDSPLFFEKKVNQPTPPSELDPMKLVTRILELPEENRDYIVRAQSRKPETIPIKRIDNSDRHSKSPDLTETLNTKPSAEPRTRRRNNTNRGRTRESTTEKSQIESRRTRKRRPVQTQSTTTTELPEIDSVTPYQKEVYDDVMGTIKNLASLYELFGAPGSSERTTNMLPNPGQILGAASIRNVQTLNRSPAASGTGEKDFRSTGVPEGPFPEEIEGLLPPPELSKRPKIMPYRTNKVSYNTRIRTQNPTRNSDKKIIGYFRTVMVHKRSLDDHSGAPRDPETDASKHTMKKRNVMDMKIEESRTNFRTVNPNAPASTTERPKRGRRRKTSLASTTTTSMPPIRSNDWTENDSDMSKSVYTIKSRSRNSKDDKSTDRYGLFTTTQRSSSTIDARRNEPRYTEIMRRRGQMTATNTTTPSPEEQLDSDSTTITENPKVHESRGEPMIRAGEMYNSENSAPRRRKIRIEKIEPSTEIYKASASDSEPEHLEDDDEDNENYEEEDEDSTEEPAKNTRKYDVHEDVQEDTTPSTKGILKPTRSSEFLDLETYLSTDPPGYSEAFSKEPEGSTVSYTNVDEPEERKENYRNEEESKEDEIGEDDEEHAENAPKNASYQEEESSDEESTENPKTSESYRDSSGENADESEEKKNSEQEDDDDKTFFRYETRPDSPFESFEDAKYSDLGPRINKPAFHHPPFEPPKLERHYFDDSDDGEKEKTEEDSKKERYEFPWVHDEEDEKAEAEGRYVEEATEKYEYPWEKRERLAEERAKRRKDRERLRKLRDFSFLHDDDDYDGDEDEDEKKGSASKTSGKQVYPWDLYDMPSKPYTKNYWKDSEHDNHETSSEHRPVAKFSSKYNSNKFKLPFAGSEPITGADPNKIKKSVLDFLNEAEEKSAEPAVAYKTDSPTIGKSGFLTTAPVPIAKIEFSKEPESSGSKDHKRISNSGIIPENVTAAPRNRGRTRGSFIRNRTTLRPVVKSTTESVVVEKTQTTTRPILATRRPSRIKGGANSTKRQPSYKAQESKISSNSVVPTPKSTILSTTEKSSSKNSVKKRGRAKNMSNNSKTSYQGQEGVTEKLTQGTTTIRRRNRPTVINRLEKTKTVLKNYENAKRPSPGDLKKSLKESTDRVPATSSVDSGNRNIENSTPTTRTVEHRSRVSKEEIITKTSFPDSDSMFKVYKDKSKAKKISSLITNFEDESLGNKKSKKTYSKTPARGKNSFGETDAENEKPERNESVEKLSITKQETPEHVYEKKEILDKDGHKGMFISITPKNRTIGTSAFEDQLHLEKAKMEELGNQEEQRYNNFEDIETKNIQSHGDTDSTSPEDIRDHVLAKISPQSNQWNEMKDGFNEGHISATENSKAEGEDRYSEEEGSGQSEEVDDTKEKSTAVNFEEDPSRRMYYYLDHEK